MSKLNYKNIRPKKSAVEDEPAHFHVMANPIGPICNLDCKYCFYLKKEKLYPHTTYWAMNEDVLESFIRDYVESQKVPVINFAWQGRRRQLGAR